MVDYREGGLDVNQPMTWEAAALLGRPCTKYERREISSIRKSKCRGAEPALGGFSIEVNLHPRD